MNKKQLLTAAALPLLLISLSGVSYGQKTEDVGIQKYLVEKGNPAAAFVLGNSYYRGKGTPQNYADAFKWLLFKEAIASAISMYA